MTEAGASVDSSVPSVVPNPSSSSSSSSSTTDTAGSPSTMRSVDGGDEFASEDDRSEAPPHRRELKGADGGDGGGVGRDKDGDKDREARRAERRERRRRRREDERRRERRKRLMFGIAFALALAAAGVAAALLLVRKPWESGGGGDGEVGAVEGGGSTEPEAGEAAGGEGGDGVGVAGGTAEEKEDAPNGGGGNGDGDSKEVDEADGGRRPPADSSTPPTAPEGAGAEDAPDREKTTTTTTVTATATVAAPAERTTGAAADPTAGDGSGDYEGEGEGTGGDDADEVNDEPDDEPEEPPSYGPNGCPPSQYPFALSLMDQWGDGWEPLSLLTLYSSVDPALPLFSDTLTDGFERSERLCLRSSACYRVAFDSGGAGKYGREMSWELRGPLASIEDDADLAERIAYGDGGGGRMTARVKECTFATAAGGEVDGCPWTCRDAADLSNDDGALPPAGAGGDNAAPEGEDEDPSEAEDPRPEDVEGEATPPPAAGEEPPEEDDEDEDVPPTTDAPESPPSDGANDADDVVAGPDVTYQPGNLVVEVEGLLLSAGLTARLIAHHRRPVKLRDGTETKAKFHEKPDFGATYLIPADSPLYELYPGGWVYVSNSELRDKRGGVGSLLFDAEGQVVDYSVLLTGTERNCGGGKTPWDTWISCEEPDGGLRDGRVFEVHPFGDRPPRVTKLGEGGGSFESFAYDVRDKKKPRFFVTEDDKEGAFRRYTPRNPDWDDPHSMLHGRGTLEYLVLEPSNATADSGVAEHGTYRWTSSKEEGDANADLYFRNSEGLDVSGKYLYFVSKRQREMFTLDLDEMTYVVQGTTNGAFDGQPDQVKKVLGDKDKDGNEGGILYFTEDGGVDAGVHGRDSDGNYFTILESRVYTDETSGLAFSPDGMHMYVCYQGVGKLFDITREDGLPFSGAALDIKYHNTLVTDIVRRRTVETAIGVRL